MESKVCSECGSNNYFCKGACRKCYNKEYRRNHIKKLMIYQKNYYEKNKKRLKICRQQKNIRLRLERNKRI
jgi:hypothetical protein